MTRPKRKRDPDGYFRRQLIFHSRQSLDAALNAARHWADSTDREEETYVFSKFVRWVIRDYIRRHKLEE